MLRSLYRTVLHLHPPFFRQRFADEMQSIFDSARSRSVALNSGPMRTTLASLSTSRSRACASVPPGAGRAV